MKPTLVVNQKHMGIMSNSTTKLVRSQVDESLKYLLTIKSHQRTHSNRRTVSLVGSELIRGGTKEDGDTPTVKEP